MKKALIVDDAAIMRIMLRTVLEQNGYLVVGEAADGQEAITKYLECQPDFVTMDISMPKMDGIQAVKEICRQDTSAKIVMVSSMGQEIFVKEAIKAGAKGFVLKPFKEDEVIRQIHRLFT
ncbi:MAG: response regulator, partial [Clostridia bacterium]|nr:response regulator [Clostridia bacterium]